MDKFTTSDRKTATCPAWLSNHARSVIELRPKRTPTDRVIRTDVREVGDETTLPEGKPLYVMQSMTYGMAKDGVFTSSVAAVAGR